LKRLGASKHFQKQLKKLPKKDQEKAVAALKRLRAALQSGTPAQGLGFKKINGDKYEFRVDLKKRIVMQSDGDTLVCHVISNHDDVRRYLKMYRNK